ncbi:TKL DRK variant 2, putative [Babesia ovata]|uniref:TKL DRK variant 2, putative n=1 Tax=Babesia ovata TaxID=189622 RepID=A0A2H6K797_9APIC|nr:TKL DRK variant 2, putative [Babesia ovata]GBE58860.1 TKL DRK variant 2, putative [Babesia ovata]
MILFNGFSMGDPGAAESPDIGKSSAENIAFYASNAELHLNLRHLTMLYGSAEKMYRNLCAISDEIEESHAPMENKEAELEGCQDAIKLVGDVMRDTKYYVELGSMLDEYRTLGREIMRECITPERSAELNSAMRGLEQKFKSKEQFASYLLAYGIGGYYINLMRDAEKFILKYAMLE